VASVKSREERIAAEERLHEPEPEPEEELADSQRLAMAMYTAWAIGRELVSDEFAEDCAKLVVAVRCGEFPVEELEAASRHEALLTDSGYEFLDWYGSGKNRRMDQDFARLSTGVALTASAASFRRMADVLDARFAEWQRAENRPVD
jgi:hypothetical protein